MNVAVKKLNALDPPVSTMELILVRMVSVHLPDHLSEKVLKFAHVSR